jgi:hypothetical protein
MVPNESGFISGRFLVGLFTTPVWTHCRVVYLPQFIDLQPLLGLEKKSVICLHFRGNGLTFRTTGPEFRPGVDGHLFTWKEVDVLPGYLCLSRIFGPPTR